MPVACVLLDAFFECQTCIRQVKRGPLVFVILKGNHFCDDRPRRWRVYAVVHDRELALTKPV